MKICKRKLLICLILAALALQIFVFPQLSGQRHTDQSMPPGNAALFPHSLKTIEDEAFVGTSFRILIFRDGFRHIGDRVFGGMELLREVQLPRTVEYIADSAFIDSSLERICGSAGSYAQEWARQHEISFEARDSWYSSPINIRDLLGTLLAWFFVLCLPLSDDRRRIKRYIAARAISMRPQDRPELNPIDYRFP